MRFYEFKDPTAGFDIAPPAGRSGPEVADVQKALQALGYDLGPHGVDGIRGPDTSAAVKQYQTDNHLTVDGDPGPETVNSLNTVLAAKPEVASKLTKSTTADVVQSAQAMAPLATDSVTAGKVGGVLDLIARYESKGDYNIIHGGQKAPLTSMTIAQVLDYQSKMIQAGHESTAVGRYQYLRNTLIDVTRGMGMDINTAKFDQQTQDNIAIYDMRRRCGLDAWLSGKLDDGSFLNKLAAVWASIPNTANTSTYAGVGSNKAGTSSSVALNTLQDIKTTA